MWRSRLTYAGLMLSVLGLGTVSAALIDTESSVAVPFLGVLSILAVVFIATRHASSGDMVFLGGVMLVGLGVRFLLMAIIHQSVGPYVFAPDAATFERNGVGIVNYWAGLGPAPASIGGSVQVGYYILNASLFVVFGNAVVAPAMVNAFLGVVVAVPVYHTALAIVRNQKAVARVAVVLTLFFPSLVLWSVLNIREAPAVFTVASAAFFFTRLSQDPRPRYLAGAIVALSVLALLREYLVMLVGIGGVAGILMALSRRPFRAFAVGGVVMLVLTMAMRTAGLGSTLAVEPDLERVATLREAMTRQAGSAFQTDVETTTIGGALTFLPLGLSRFLFGPYPWTIARGSLLQALTLPEVLLWYALIPFLIRGVYLGFRNDPSSFTVVGAMFLIVTTAYALVEGNAGTAYRHRAQVMPLAFFFVALGFRDWWAVRTIRRHRADAMSRDMARLLEERRAGTAR